MKISELKGYKEFKAVCNYALCEKFYPGWVGDDKYIIISDLSDDELKQAFPEIMDSLSPYVLVGRFFGRMNDHMRYVEKKEHEMCEFYIDVTENYEDRSSGFVTPDFSDGVYLSEMLKQAMEILTPFQKNRIEKFYFSDMTAAEIAASEGTTRQCVEQSITLALKKMKKFLS